MTSPSKIATHFAVAASDLMDISEHDARHQTAESHSLRAGRSTVSAGVPTTITILPSASISTFATDRPAALAPLTARVRSRCLNLSLPCAIVANRGACRAGWHDQIIRISRIVNRPRRQQTNRSSQVIVPALPHVDDWLEQSTGAQAEFGSGVPNSAVWSHPRIGGQHLAAAIMGIWAA